MVEIRPGLVVPDEELVLTAARAGGPGGQHVNKTSTKVVLRFDLEATAALDDATKARLRARIPPRYLTQKGEVLLASERFRDQARNREDVVARFAEVLRGALARPKRRIPTKPSKASKARTRQAKQEHSQKKKERRRKDYD